MNIRLPQTSLRREPGVFLKALRRVDAFANLAFGFEGPVLRPGAEVDAATLPRPTVVLECAGRAGAGRGQPTVWILWRLLENGTWQRLARAEAFDWTWSLALRPLAVRALREGAAEAPPADLPGITERIVAELDRELSELSPAVQAHLLGRIELALNARIAAVA